MKALYDRVVLEAIHSNAVFAFSLSGGKDSTAAAAAAQDLLNQLGHTGMRVAIHADLGRAEWKQTPETVERIADDLDLPLMVVRHSKHDMVSRWEARFEEGKRRYRELEVFNLIGPWSSASLRFCTAEMKQQVIAPALLKRFPGRRIVSVVGLRREESAGRKDTPVSREEPRWARANGTRMLTWHPVADWSAGDVFNLHAVRDLSLHAAYTRFGSSRLSCAFCIMQSQGDQAAAISCRTNEPLYLHLVEIEARSTFSFQPERWLADQSPVLQSPELRGAVEAGKRRSAERRRLEAALPADLRYVKGWPLRAPTYDEARDVAKVRRAILGHHALPELYPTPEAIIARFEELLALKAEKEVANTRRLAA